MTDSKRVFDLAKELNISHTDILDFLKSKNIPAKSPMSRKRASALKGSEIRS